MLICIFNTLEYLLYYNDRIPHHLEIYDILSMKVTSVVASRISVNDHIQTVTKKKDVCDTNEMICKYFLFQFSSIKPTFFLHSSKCKTILPCST